MNCKSLLTIIKHLRIYSSLSTFSVMLRPLLERHLFHWSLVFIVISAKINISSSNTFSLLDQKMNAHLVLYKINITQGMDHGVQAYEV